MVVCFGYVGRCRSMFLVLHTRKRYSFAFTLLVTTPRLHASFLPVGLSLRILSSHVAAFSRCSFARLPRCTLHAFLVLRSFFVHTVRCVLRRFVVRLPHAPAFSLLVLWLDDSVTVGWTRTYTGWHTHHRLPLVCTHALRGYGLIHLTSVYGLPPPCQLRSLRLPRTPPHVPVGSRHTRLHTHGYAPHSCLPACLQFVTFVYSRCYGFAAFFFFFCYTLFT